MAPLEAITKLPEIPTPRTTAEFVFVVVVVCFSFILVAGWGLWLKFGGQKKYVRKPDKDTVHIEHKSDAERLASVEQSIRELYGLIRDLTKTQSDTTIAVTGIVNRIQGRLDAWEK